LQGAAIQNHRRRLALAAGKLTQQYAQILDQNLKTLSVHPAPHLLINHRPGRQIVRHHAPLVAGLYDIAQSVEYRSQRMLSLRCILTA
jgi:hypothetical protein